MNNADTTTTKIAPESDTGNVEYKLQLLRLSEKRIEELATQMKYRLFEGKGECRYEIGVADNGELIGLEEQSRKTSIHYLKKIIKKANANILYTHTQKLDNERCVSTIIIRENCPEDLLNIRVAISGSANCGKSTLLGVLVSGEKDNGRGFSRSFVMNHRHEHETGRTSSITSHILGYDKDGNIVNNITTFDSKKTWPDIISKSSKVISIFDLAGHEKYLKTTISGLSGMYPDYALILVGANMKPTEMTKEHIRVCRILKIPFIVLISKVDIAPKNILKETMSEITKIIRMCGIKKYLYTIKTEDELLRSLENIRSEAVIPVIQFSNVTSYNLFLIKKLLNYLPQRVHYTSFLDSEVHFSISEVFNVPGVGIVVYGTLMSGTITESEKLYLGPDLENKFISIRIRSIEHKRSLVNKAIAGQMVCLAIKSTVIKITRNSIKKGMVILSNSNPVLTREFKAKVVIFKGHSTTIKEGYESVVYIGNIRQSCKMINILNTDKLLRSGDECDVIFKFKFYPVYIATPNQRFIFQEGKTKGAGIIQELL